MAATRKIPLRPKDDKFALSAKEKDCIVWYVLSGYTKDDAFVTFVRPDLAISKLNLRKASTQFFDSPEAQKYMIAYRNTLDGEFSEKEEVAVMDLETKKERAVRKFTENVIVRMEDVESVEDMDAMAKLADRVGILSEKEEVVEKPRRYLPERCSECRYKSFVESAVKDGEAEDCCNRCNALKFAKDMGFRYDPTRLLERQEQLE